MHESKYPGAKLREVILRRPLREIVEATLVAAGRSAHTRRSYEVAIAYFIHYLDLIRGPLIPDAGRPMVRKIAGDLIVDVTVDTGKKASAFEYRPPAGVLRLADQSLVDGFTAWRRAMGDSTNSAQARLYAVRTFLSIALREGVLTSDQARNMGLEAYKTRQKRDIKPAGRRLSPEEVQALRAAPDLSTAKGKRDMAILDLGLYMGLRESEIAGLKTDHLVTHDGALHVELIGKGEKTRRLRITPVLGQSLKAWLNEIHLVPSVDDEYIFCSVGRWGEPRELRLAPTDIGRIIAGLGFAAGISEERGKKRLGSLDLRRTCARNAYDNSADILGVMQMLGHSDPKTTMHYIGLDEEASDKVISCIKY